MGAGSGTQCFHESSILLFGVANDILVAECDAILVSVNEAMDLKPDFFSSIPAAPLVATLVVVVCGLFNFIYTTLKCRSEYYQGDKTRLERDKLKAEQLARETIAGPPSDSSTSPAMVKTRWWATFPTIMLVLTLIVSAYNAAYFIKYMSSPGDLTRDAVGHMILYATAIIFNWLTQVQVMLTATLNDIFRTGLETRLDLLKTQSWSLEFHKMTSESVRDLSSLLHQVVELMSDTVKLGDKIAKLTVEKPRETGAPQVPACAPSPSGSSPLGVAGAETP